MAITVDTGQTPSQRLALKSAGDGEKRCSLGVEYWIAQIAKK